MLIRHATEGELTKQQKKSLFGYGKYRYYKKIRKDGFKQYQTVPYTRRLAIRYYCLECVGFDYSEMANCTMPECPLFQYRFGTLPEEKTPIDRAKAIRNFCMECSCGDPEYIADCPAKLCPAQPYRLSGYRTDMGTLIPSDKLAFLPGYEEGIDYLKQKTAVQHSDEC